MKTTTAALVVASTLMLSGCTSVPAPSSDSSSLIERERELTRALTHRHQATVNTYLAKDFTCTANGQKPFTLISPAARYSLCTGLGEGPSGRAPLTPAIETANMDIPRTAVIESIRVEPLDATSAVVISTQRYVNWIAYDGTRQRRAEVRDTWTLDAGVWLLKERITTPLGEAAVASN